MKTMKGEREKESECVKRVREKETERELKRDGERER